MVSLKLSKDPFQVISNFILESKMIFDDEKMHILSLSECLIYLSIQINVFINENLKN